MNDRQLCVLLIAALMLAMPSVKLLNDNHRWAALSILIGGIFMFIVGLSL